MGGKQHKRQEQGRGSEAHGHQRPGDPAHPQPGRPSREQAQKHGRGKEETERRHEDDLLREEDLHDENL
ncbi:MULTISPECIES: hypothetical protein [Streptomyces]|uniref:hypothetical protein n=1 Tax=Streptomyces TaxID=1883 RepID=UPI00099038EC|nr:MULTISPECIES: hypothetical protein [unclassified Streptomyces]AQT75583.1 hypothetical protein B1K54_31685 [Streptomyces sp. fd1-xmd]MDX6761186.1 hypothetical protein [Streptomyces sp. F8]